MVIDPEVTAVLALIRESGRPPLHTLSPAEAREVSARGRAVMQPDPPDCADITELTCPGPAGPIRLRRYRGIGTSAETPLPCLVYYHGGGWVIGDLDSHDQPCRALANAAGCVVISVDYRLAPEHKYPAAVVDSAAALRWINAEAGSLGIDPKRIAVGGDSAGGNLATVMALLGKAGEVPMPMYQLLIYPAVDLTATHQSYQRITEGFILVTQTMHWFRDHYLVDLGQAVEWRASPLRAISLAGLPPAFVLTVGHDPLCDEGIGYARRLDNEGVRVTHVHMSDQMHAFLTMGKYIGASGHLIELCASALRDVWRR